MPDDGADDSAAADWAATLLGGNLPRVVLVETAAGLPGLLPWASWEALQAADVVWATDAEAHPSTPYLMLAGVSLQTLAPSELALSAMSLMAPGAPRHRRLAKAMLDRAVADGPVTFLLAPGEDALTQAVGLAGADVGAEIEFVFLTPYPAGSQVLRLAEVMARLRDPNDGCPWDLEQDHTTLVPYLLEEAHELVEAIEVGDDDHLVEELGDVLLQVVFHAQVGRDRRAFDLDDVARGIVDKLVSRHPHVFADGAASTADEVQENWDRLKAAEKQHRTGAFEGIPTSLPALQSMEKHQRRASKLGFDWPDAFGPAATVRSELDEVLGAEVARREEEVGDLLGAVVALARHLDVDPESALRAGVRKFARRVDAMVELAGDAELTALAPQAWTDLWERVKADEDA